MVGRWEMQSLKLLYICTRVYWVWDFLPIYIALLFSGKICSVRLSLCPHFLFVFIPLCIQSFVNWHLSIFVQPACSAWAPHQQQFMTKISEKMRKHQKTAQLRRKKVTFETSGEKIQRASSHSCCSCFWCIFLSGHEFVYFPRWTVEAHSCQENSRQK